MVPNDPSITDQMGSLVVGRYHIRGRLSGFATGNEIDDVSYTYALEFAPGTVIVPKPASAVLFLSSFVIGASRLHRRFAA